MIDGNGRECALDGMVREGLTEYVTFELEHKI